MLPKITYIKKLRRDLNISQIELCNILNIHQSALSRIENGCIDPPYSKVKLIYEYLAKRINRIILNPFITIIQERLNMCESPIEKILYISLCDKIDLIPQFRIDKLRVDFAILPQKIVIECDGRENHSSVKDINCDNWRDAFLHSEGWAVQRFTGNDILTNLDWCVNRILKIIRKKE